MTCELIHGDCLEEMARLEAASVDAVICDPPYPDYHAERYCYSDGILERLTNFPCRQLVFWSAKCDFPLSHTAIHIWDKKTGCGSEYERIFERNGAKNFKVFRYYLINSVVAASFTGDTFTGHPSQKPVQLMMDLVQRFTKVGDTIFDPYMGSGSTGVACANLNRNFIGIEKDADYFAIAQKRIAEAQEINACRLPLELTA